MRTRRSVGTTAAALLLAACAAAPHATIPGVVAPTTTTAAPVAPTTTAAPSACTNAVASIAPSGPNAAPGAMPAGTFLSTIQTRGRLIAGVDPSTQQFSARNPFTGQLEGFDIDMVKAVAKAIFGDPNKVEYHVIDYAQRIPALQAGTVDIVADTMTINCARWQLIDFSTEYLHAGQRVMVRSDSTLTSIAQMAAAHTHVCSARGSTNIDNLRNYPGVVVVPVDNLATCLVLFQSDEVEAVTADDTVLAGFAAQDPYAKIVGPEFTDEPYGLGIAQSHRDLVQFVNNVIEGMRTDGSWKAMYARWIATKGGPIPDPPPAVYGR